MTDLRGDDLQAARVKRSAKRGGNITLAIPAQFDDPGLIAGKGWNFNIAFVALGAGPPTYAAGTLPTAVAGSVCTTN